MLERVYSFWNCVGRGGNREGVIEVASVRNEGGRRSSF